MKIGILGAPESGKTAFAKKLAGALVPALGARPKIVDGYVERLSARTGYEFGHFASYPQNLQVQLERWTREQEATVQHGDIITCGTIYETNIYCAIKGFHAEAYEQDQKVADFLQLRATMAALGMLESSTFDYDALFYLPYDPQKVIEKDNTWDLVVDRKVPEVLEGYFKSAVELHGPVKEKVEFARDIITALKADLEAAPLDESGVRGS